MLAWAWASTTTVPNQYCTDIFAQIDSVAPGSWLPKSYKPGVSDRARPSLWKISGVRLNRLSASSAQLTAAPTYHSRNYVQSIFSRVSVTVDQRDGFSHPRYEQASSLLQSRYLQYLVYVGTSTGFYMLSTKHRICKSTLST